MIRYLAEGEVADLLPAPLAAVDLAATALRLLSAGAAELPPKPAVHPRPDGFANAMPAYVADGDLLGLKWIAAYRANPERGLPAVSGLVLLSDAGTGQPRAVLGAAALTGLRTAAVSGACLRALSPSAPGHLAIVGAGLQARTHLAVAQALGLRDVRVVARRPTSARAVAAWAASHVPDVHLTVVAAAADAVPGAAAVVTAVPIGAGDAALAAHLLREDALVLPLDYATSVGADALGGALLLADDVAQFERYRDDGSFPGYPAPAAATGAALDAPRPAGRVVAQNLGTGVVDLLFADAVVSAAERAGAGVSLPR